VSTKVKVRLHLQLDVTVTGPRNTNACMATNVRQVLSTNQMCGRRNVGLRTEIRRIFWSRRLTVDICALILFLPIIFALLKWVGGVMVGTLDL